MKKIKDFIGDCIVNLIIVITFLLLPIMKLFGILIGLFEKHFTHRKHPTNSIYTTNMTQQKLIRWVILYIIVHIHF